MKYAKENPDKIKVHRVRALLKKRYKISVEDYEKLRLLQKGLCAICEEVCPTQRALAVDHCHSSNRIRGLLCTNCNTGIGQFKDSTILLEKAISYLNARN